MALGSTGGWGAPAPRPRAAPPRPPPPPKLRFQIPEKSTLPSAVRGAGPSRAGLPSAARGTPGVGYDGHCAPMLDDMTMTAATTTATMAPQLLTPDLLRTREAPPRSTHLMPVSPAQHLVPRPAGGRRVLAVCAERPSSVSKLKQKRK